MKQLKYLATLGELVLVALLLQRGYVIDGFDFFGIQIRKPGTEQSTPNTTPQPAQREVYTPPPSPQHTTIYLAYAGRLRIIL